MRRYNLRYDIDGLWLAIDQLTNQPAKLDEITVSGMTWSEAVEFVDLLNSLDRIEQMSERYATHIAAE